MQQLGTHPPAQPLVIVVGAGASKEANLPTGEELKASIADALGFRMEDGYQIMGGDQRIVEAIHQLAQNSTSGRGDVTPYLRAARLIRAAMPQAQSIDNFIDAHRGDEYVAACGKLAIAACILKAEGRSKLHVDRSNVYNMIKFADVASTWFNAFFQLLSENCQRNDIRERLKNVTIVCFNYDRCIQHFLHEALQNYYSFSAEEAADLLAGFMIYHPYGTVGPLPWTKKPSSIDFGGKPHSRELVALSQKLRTFTEGTDESASDIIAIRSAIRSAERIVFLGSAFHPLNMELLFGSRSVQGSVGTGRIYATALGLSETNADLVASDLSEMAGVPRQHILLRRDLTASQLIRDFWRSLSVPPSRSYPSSQEVPVVKAR